MNTKLDLSRIKEIPIIEVAERLGVQVRGTKAMCFNGHDKASPSLSFYKSRNTWKCFGACGKHGDGITLVMEKEELDFKGALEWFARNFAIDVTHHYLGHAKRSRMLRPKKPVVHVSSPTEQQDFFPDPELYKWLIEKCGKISSQTGLEYLVTHGISNEATTRFNIRELQDPSRAFQSLLREWGPERVYRSGLTESRLASVPFARGRATASIRVT